MTKISNKFYIVAFFILFAISTAILLTASMAKDPVPAGGGYLDVGIVGLIAIAGFTIHQRNKNGIPRYDIGQPAATYLFPLIFVGMWIYRNSLDFNILLRPAWHGELTFSLASFRTLSIYGKRNKLNE